MTNPDILEIQRKNLALTQNFMIYQQRFQVFMMMNLKSMLNNPTITMPTSIKIEEQGVKMTETQKNKDNEKKNEKNLALEQIATQIKQENPFNQGGLKREIPDSLKNMINFLHNSFKENLSKDDLPK